MYEGPIIGAFLKPVEALATTDIVNTFDALKSSTHVKPAYTLVDGAIEPHCISLNTSSSAIFGVNYGVNYFTTDNTHAINFVYKNSAASLATYGYATSKTSAFIEGVVDAELVGNSRSIIFNNAHNWVTPRVFLCNTPVKLQILSDALVGSSSLVQNGIALYSELSAGVCVELPYNQELPSYRLTPKVTSKTEARTLDGVLRTTSVSSNIINEISLSYKFNANSEVASKLHEILALRAKTAGPLLYVAPDAGTGTRDIQLLSVTNDPDLYQIDVGVYTLNITGEYLQ